MRAGLSYIKNQFRTIDVQKCAQGADSIEEVALGTVWRIEFCAFGSAVTRSLSPPEPTLLYKSHRYPQGL